MIIALAVLLIALSVGGSLAYFSETSEIYHNIITTGAIDVELMTKSRRMQRLSRVSSVSPPKPRPILTPASPLSPSIRRP